MSTQTASGQTVSGQTVSRRIANRNGVNREIVEQRYEHRGFGSIGVCSMVCQWLAGLGVVIWVGGAVLCCGCDRSVGGRSLGGVEELVEGGSDVADVLVVPSRRWVVDGAPELVRDRCPSGMTLIPVSTPFCIHRWEAQIFHENGNLHNPYHVPPYPAQMGGMVAKALPGVVPQGYVGRDQAEVLCRNAGFRLCSAKEWRVACAGPAAALFPYGTNYRIDGRCNTHKYPSGEHIVVQLYPATQWSTREMNDPRINQFEGGLATTGEYVGCTNAYGVFDMVGNLQEWVEDLVEEGKNKGNAIALGDHYMGQGRNFEGCEARNVAHRYYAGEAERNQRDYSTGFRCCAEPY